MSKHPQVPPLIGTAEIVRRHHISTPTVTRAVAAGDLVPVWRGPGPNGTLVFIAADVDTWIASRRSDR